MGCHFHPPGDLSDPGIKPASSVSPALQAASLPARPSGKPTVLTAYLVVIHSDVRLVFVLFLNVCYSFSKRKKENFKISVIFLNVFRTSMLLILSG